MKLLLANFLQVSVDSRSFYSFHTLKVTSKINESRDILLVEYGDETSAILEANGRCRDIDRFLGDVAPSIPNCDTNGA